MTERRRNLMWMGLPISFGVICAISYLIHSSSFAADAIEGPADGAVTQSQAELREGESLQGATSEKHVSLEEERRRLSGAAAGFGTDPTAIIGYYQFMYAHSTSTNNQRLDTVTATVRLPVTPNLGLQVNMPYTWAA